MMASTLIKILSGLDSIIGGLAGLSNNLGDRHADKFNTRMHHDILAVNTAMGLSDFLIGSFQYKNENKLITK